LSNPSSFLSKWTDLGNRAAKLATTGNIVGRESIVALKKERRISSALSGNVKN